MNLEPAYFPQTPAELCQSPWPIFFNGPRGEHGRFFCLSDNEDQYWFLSLDSATPEDCFLLNLVSKEVLQLPLWTEPARPIVFCGLSTTPSDPGCILFLVSESDLYLPVKYCKLQNPVWASVRVELEWATSVSIPTCFNGGLYVYDALMGLLLVDVEQSVTIPIEGVGCRPTVYYKCVPLVFKGQLCVISMGDFEVKSRPVEVFNFSSREVEVEVFKFSNREWVRVTSDELEDCALLIGTYGCAVRSQNDFSTILPRSVIFKYHDHFNEDDQRILYVVDFGKGQISKWLPYGEANPNPWGNHHPNPWRNHHWLL